MLSYSIIRTCVISLLMRQLKIDVLSALVVTDKLEFGEPQASGKSVPAGVTESTASVYCIAFYHPSGAPFYFIAFRRLRPLGATSASRSTPTQVAGLPPASVLSPTSWAQNSSGFQPEKFQFVVDSKQYSLIAGAIIAGTPELNLHFCFLLFR